MAKATVFTYSNVDKKLVNKYVFLLPIAWLILIFSIIYFNFVANEKVNIGFHDLIFTSVVFFILLVGAGIPGFIIYCHKVLIEKSELSLDAEKIQLNSGLSKRWQNLLFDNSKQVIQKRPISFQDWELKWSEISHFEVKPHANRYLLYIYKANRKTASYLLAPEHWYASDDKREHRCGMMCPTHKQIPKEALMKLPLMMHLKVQGIPLTVEDKATWQEKLQLMVAAVVLGLMMLIPISTLWSNYQTFLPHTAADEPSMVHQAKASQDYVLPTQEQFVFREHDSNVIALAFHPDGKTLISGGKDRQIKHWQVADGKVLHSWQAHNDKVQALAFSPDGELFASASEDATVKLWRTDTGEELHRFRLQAEGNTRYNGFFDVAFSPNGRLLAAASWNGNTVIWDVAQRSQVQLLIASHRTWFGWGNPDGHGHTNSVDGLSFSPDGTYLATSGFDDLVKIWHVADGQWIRDLVGHQKWVYGVAYSPDGERIASSGMDNTVRLWDSNTGKLLYTLPAHRKSISSVAFSPDGKILASSSDDYDAKLWEVSSGALLATLKGHKDFVNKAIFSPDGQLFATASGDDTVKLWHRPNVETAAAISK